MKSVKTPATAEELRAAVVSRYDGLSKRLQQVGRYVLDDPHAIGIETLAVIAERAGVQPSTIVRFAKELGFSGASQMQRLFREDLLRGESSVGYGERVRRFNELASRKKLVRHSDVLAEFVEGSTLALGNLAKSVSEDELKRAVALVDRAESVFIAGFRRAFPVAAYLAYMLQQVSKRTMFVDGTGGLNALQLKTIGPSDLLIAVSYHPYAPETIQAVDAAHEAGAKILSIGDSQVSPAATKATLALQVRESEVRGFRSLAASMCLAQALVIDLALEKTRQKKAARNAG